MATTHIVKNGENLTVIARKYGYTDGLFLYNHSSNTELRKKRPNPNIVLAGDKVNIPDKSPGPPPPKTEFSLSVIDSMTGKAFPGLTAKLKLPDGTVKEFVTDGTGSIKLTEPDIQAGRVDVQDLTDKSEPQSPEISYSTFTRTGLPTDASNVIHAPNKRAVINAIASKFSIARRSAWGKKKPNYAAMDSDWDYEIVTLHHSGRSGEKDPITIEEKHMVGRGWDDVGYHYIIEPNGDIYEGRYLSLKGSHVESANTGKIGILLTGDFESEYGGILGGVPTAAQLSKVEDFIKALKGFFSTLKKLGGHRDYKPSTVCPGGELYKLIPGLRTKTSLGGP
ncbi:MAG TPA: peptidoglycan recognition family protein [Bryobacteraceae bacterium]|jgi:hypothetical protein|nr:peptidoglycan recognition family protein [Bryobacteraceae bacterium]